MKWNNAHGWRQWMIKRTPHLRLSDFGSQCDSGRYNALRIGSRDGQPHPTGLKTNNLRDAIRWLRAEQMKMRILGET